MVTTLNDKNFRNHLEDCMSFGKPMLIENIEEELDPLLDPILEKRIVRKGKSAMIVLSTERRWTSPTASPSSARHACPTRTTLRAVRQNAGDRLHRHHGGSGGPAPREAHPEGEV